MKITISNIIRIDDPTDEILFWCKKNLVIPNPDYAKKVRMHLWLGDTPSHIHLYEQVGKSLILPFGALRQLPESDATYTTDFSNFLTVSYGDDVPLYDYQKIATGEVFSQHYGILQSPAGSGKTQMGISLIKMFGKRALWLTHTLDLLKQSKSRAERYISKDLIGTVSEGKVNIGEGVTFATIQTMCKLDLPRYKDYWDVIIIDECHRAAGSPTSLTQFYKVVNSLSARHKIGLSATVHRSDGLIATTHALLGEVVYTVPDEAVKGQVMQVGVYPVNTGVVIERKCLNTDGTLNYANLIRFLSMNFDRNEIILKYIWRNQDRPCLILSERIIHLEYLMSQLPMSIKGAVMISGKMTTKKAKAEREQAIEDMRTGKKNLLFATYALAKEGLDIPCLEHLLLATPQKDYAVVTQSIGRIARVCGGKRNPVVYDFVDDIGYLVKAYKKRCATYRKNGCYFMEEDRCD